MIKCWGEEFPSVQALWEDGRCHVATVHTLRHRLKSLCPEDAVVPEYYCFLGQKFNSIYALHRHGVGESISESSLYKRLGLVYCGRKITVEQATCPTIWNRIKKVVKLHL